jgi:hypothetical protein
VAVYCLYLPCLRSFCSTIHTNTPTLYFLRLTAFFNIASSPLYHVFPSFAIEMIGDSLCKYCIVLIEIYSISSFLFF